MHYLGIPTTRAGSIIVADDKVIRDPLYKNKQILEPVSIVMRMAPNFIRFGSFEICKVSDFNSGPSKNMDQEMLNPLLEYLLKYHFTHISAQ